MTAIEVEELITIPMEDPLARHAGRRVRALLVRDGTLASRAALQDGHRPHGCAAARAGAPEARHRGAAESAGHAGHAPTALLDQPGHEDRHHIEGLTTMMDLSMIAYWTIKFRLMCGPRRGQHSHLGRADQVAAGPGRPEPDARPRRDARRGHGDRPRTRWISACCRTAPRPRPASTGCIDTPNQRFAIHNESPVFSPEHLAAVPLTLKGEAADPRRGWAMSARWSGTPGPLIGDAVINDERRPDADRREAALGQHAGSHARHRGGARRA